MVEVRIARVKDMADLAPRLRKADVEEVYASSGLDPFTALVEAFSMSVRTWVYTVDGQVECVFGIAELSTKVGVPWMLGSNVVPRYMKRLVVDGISIVRDMSAAYPTLLNAVHVKNEASIRWLRYLGFQLLPAIEHGPFKELFYPFYRHNNV